MSVFSEKDKFFFVHVPKNAGMSIAKSLLKDKLVKPFSFGAINRKIPDLEGLPTTMPRRPIHATFSQINGVLPLDDYKVGAFIRNPWDRLFSFFSMVSIKDAKGKNADKMRHVYSPVAFKIWMLEDKLVLKETGEKVPFIKPLRNGVKPRRFKFMGFESEKTFQTVPQSFWITDNTGEIAVDFLGRYENLQDDYNKMIEDVMGVRRVPRLLHVHNSNKPNYRDVYDQEMIDFVAKHNKDDIERFGYDF